MLLQYSRAHYVHTQVRDPKHFTCDVRGTNISQTVSTTSNALFPWVRPSISPNSGYVAYANSRLCYLHHSKFNNHVNTIKQYLFKSHESFINVSTDHVRKY